VNRIFDADGSEGIDLIRAIKNDPQLSAVPVMMITNFPDHQQLAVAAGALPGFGKRDLGSPEMLDTVGTVLNGTLNKTS
jgi:CheY-like chemotaxis protein